MKVTNENYSIGPLYLRDKIMMEWLYDQAEQRFKLDNIIQNPPGYPTFDF